MNVYSIAGTACSPFKKATEEFPLPKGSKILSLRLVNNNLIMYYQFEVHETETEVRTLIYRPCAVKFYDHSEKFIDTVELGTNAIHIFEL